MNTLIILLISVFGLCLGVYDPENIFCGKANCYELLGLTRDASNKDIRKAFRSISLTQHPDKSKDDTNTESFKLISKAYEVLSVNESKVLFDYYLDHPYDYFRVSGHHPEKVAPKTSLTMVIIGFLLILSLFVHFVQLQRYEKLNKYLSHAAFNNLGIKAGGTKQTLELNKRAVSIYNERSKDGK